MTFIDPIKHIKIIKFIFRLKKELDILFFMPHLCSSLFIRHTFKGALHMQYSDFFFLTPISKPKLSILCSTRNFIVFIDENTCDLYKSIFALIHFCRWNIVIEGYFNPSCWTFIWLLHQYKILFSRIDVFDYIQPILLNIWYETTIFGTWHFS